MRKFMSILVVLLFLPFIRAENDDDLLTIDNGNYCILQLENALYMYNEGYPILPYYVKTFTYPAGTKINEISVEVKKIEEIKLEKKIQPAPPAMPLNMEYKYEIKEGEIYSKDEFYPDKWYDYSIGMGIKDGKRVVFLNIYLYPVRYNAIRNEVLYARDFDISIDYKLPSQPLFNKDEYDLLIICPSKFEDELQPLVEHKENHGIKTIVMTTENIYSQYNGRDEAEKIKYAIKDAIEQYGIKYVMLVGGLSSLISSDTWLVPVRYVKLDDNSRTEYSYISDLYFADIYKYEDGKPVFDDWDSNGNGIFAEWWMKGKDELDLYPDVYLGRLACRNEKEVQYLVNKIIEYENNAYGSEWFKRVLLVAGDTFNDAQGWYEGEIATAKTAEYLSDFEAVKIWYSEGNLNQKNVVSAFSQGEGFVHFSGHGSPGMWLAKSFEGGKAKYILGLDIYHMPMLKNKGMYPVVVIGGCHNSMFNTTLVGSTVEIIKSIIFKYILGKHFVTWFWIPCPECFGWFIVRQPAGGAIASIGCTGLGYGTIGDSDKDGIPDCIQYLLGWAETNFFRLYSEGVDVLAEAHATVLTEYISKFDPHKDRIDCKTVEEWVLLGDPTLKIGGYQ